jgi:hypothetical protein
VRINPPLLMSVLVAGGIGNWLGRTFGAVASPVAIRTLNRCWQWSGISPGRCRLGMPCQPKLRVTLRPFVMTREHAGPGGFLGTQAFIWA